MLWNPDGAPQPETASLIHAGQEKGLNWARRVKRPRAAGGFYVPVLWQPQRPQRRRQLPTRRPRKNFFASVLDFYLSDNSALGRTTYSLPRGAPSCGVTRRVETAPQRGGPSSAVRCAPRGFASGRHVRESRAAPKPTPLVTSLSSPPSFPPSPRLSWGRAARQSRFHPPPRPPRSRLRPDGCGICACAPRARRWGWGGVPRSPAAA